MTFKQHSMCTQRAVNKRSIVISLNVHWITQIYNIWVIFIAIHNSVNQRHCYWVYEKPPTPTSATRYEAYFGRVALVRQRAPAVPCCLARETTMLDTTKTHLRRWSRGGKMAVASRDRKRRSAATRRQWRRAEVEHDGQSARLPVRASYQPSDASSCIDDFETRSLPDENPHKFTYKYAIQILQETTYFVKVTISNCKFQKDGESGNIVNKNECSSDGWMFCIGYLLLCRIH